MAKKNGKEKQPPQQRRERIRPQNEKHFLKPETKRSLWGVVCAGLAIIFALAGFEAAGPAGAFLYWVFEALLGVGYFILPLAFLTLAIIFLGSEERVPIGITLGGTLLALVSALGLIHLAQNGSGGLLGWIFGFLKLPFGTTAASVITVVAFLAGTLLAVNAPLHIRLRWRKMLTHEKPPIVTGEGKETTEPETPSRATEEAPEEHKGDEPPESRERSASPKNRAALIPKHALKNYTPPPLSLLKSTHEKPTTGDLRANANIIKRTLESFGIPVEMGEINIGPTVTRYTLKPAEGVKLSRITALNQDLALALAAHPIRIEAPIPGKSLVGIEVPNKAAALVRLGSIMAYPDFQNAGVLNFVMGRDVNGEPVFADIDKMPHLLIAGATGSGKSVTIQTLLISLLYKNSPASLRLILIDPKRVELSIYDGLPHLATPVITENKKAVGVFRWAIKEMDRRYELLLASGRRDIQGYNKINSDDPLPYLLVVVDELADLMTTFGREVEGSIIRLAQMARATGIHLVLSTQRPSVEVITGLIKANITTRVALQVASQIDSRTILDTAGAEKLLGHGDLLYLSAELSKPKRIQGAYVSEEEIRGVIEFIKDNNKAEAESLPIANGNENNGAPLFDMSGSSDEYLEDEDDELYGEAVKVVAQAKKASASLLQRRLSVGYARAARLLDLMEMRGVIGPGEGAKPREVFLDKIGD